MKTHPRQLRAISFALIVGCVAIARAAPPPDFGPNVVIVDPATPNLQSKLDAIFKQQEKNQFGTERHAILFKPGKYSLDVRVGFYTHVAGLGRSPDDVEIVGAVNSTAEWMRGNATCNFWRCVENLCVDPAPYDKLNIWAVSQGVAMRRTHIKGDLDLWDGGWSSGGFLADSRIDGDVDSGSQQQWFSRNSQWTRWRGGNWNMVFVGDTNAPQGKWPERPYTVVDRTPVIREKPYLIVDADDRYFVVVPELQREGAQGITWASGKSAGKEIPIEQFYLAHAERDNADSINAELASGKNLLLTPGIYHLESAIRVTRPDTVVFGLGYPTLAPDKGTAAISVADVDGVTLAGLLVEAGANDSPTLVQIGDEKSAVSHAANPTFLFDIFCRAGGAVAGSARCLVTINSNNVVGDNFWLWRADHGTGAKWDVNKNRNGLIVNGNDVTMYGLFVEHSQEYQTVWNGEGGRVYFYQSEMPYDPPTQDAWMHGNVRGYASYKVADNVKTHEAWGLGIYCVFYEGPIIAETAIEAPEVEGVKLHHLITVRLNGRPGSGINHVINSRGEAVIDKHETRME